MLPLRRATSRLCAWAPRSKAGETLCIIEAMKVLNEVTAEADGEVLEICVADGDLVEFGSCLMRIG